jgi:hypothetical protein
MQNMTQVRGILSALVLGLAACGTAPSAVSLYVPQPNANALTAQVGNDTLVLSTAELVLRKVQLQREGGNACNPNSGSGTDDKDCPEMKAGPFIVSMPLDGSVVGAVDAELPAGTYKRLKLQIHKLTASDDPNLVASRPDLDDASIKVTGIFNGAAFTYLGQLDVQQSHDFEPALVVAGGQTTNITLSVDVLAWFKTSVGAYIDPASANHGGPNVGLVNSNIQASFRGFEDKNHDGRDDHGTH